MPQLDWNGFGQLPGSKHRNFEDLCRGMVRKHYGGFGIFRALKNQPGVEFHIELAETHPALGVPPRWWGWQCKDHARVSSGDLSAASKADIEDSLAKTEKHLPNLTDWVLWTPYTLSKKDQEWFEGLETGYVLHMWAEEEVESHLDGPGLLLRQTYFGELVLVPQELAQQHAESVQPIKERWVEPVHQEVGAERELHQILGRVDAWENFKSVGERLATDINCVNGFSESFDDEFNEQLTKFCSIGTEIAGSLKDFHSLLGSGDLEAIQQVLQVRRTLIDKAVLATPRKLRNFNHPVSLNATNALDDMRLAIDLFASVEEYLGIGIVALLADAGGGKTQTAAQLTAPTSTLPAGVLLHGRSLHKGQSLDNLAANFRISGTPIESMEKLLAAVDAAAKRAGCRLPIVIDGLNEAENPKEWRSYLAGLSATIGLYPNVVVICTLRTGEHRREATYVGRPHPSTSRETFAELALPDGIRRIESEGFGENTADAIDKYFAFFKIRQGDSEIPHSLFSHPLTLRIYCQTTNPDRKSEVTVDHFPTSLWPLLENYLEHTCNRITELENLSYSYNKTEIRAAIHQLGVAIWDARSREISDDRFRSAVSDNNREWDSSIVNLLAQEGIIFRDPGRQPGEFVLTPAYDALGGFIVARALIDRDDPNQPFRWLRREETFCGNLAAIFRRVFRLPPSEIGIDVFVGEASHELSTDIFRALVALTPAKLPGKQFWKELPSSLRAAALRLTTEIDADLIDKETIGAFAELIRQQPHREVRLFGKLRTTRAIKNHPLNAMFLDELLLPMTVADRDLGWTEWVRASKGGRLADVLAVESTWKESTSRSDADLLVAKWMKWLLSSTDRELRDVATRALYWFGRKYPEKLFDETLSSLATNDPYIPERMLAASYGAAMANYSGQLAHGDSIATLTTFAGDLFRAMFAEGAHRRSTHFLTRDYASKLVELAWARSSGVFTAEDFEQSQTPYDSDTLDSWGEIDFDRTNVRGRESPLHMDFENYTIGSLVPSRPNYDFENIEYRHVRAKILWRISQLGWSSERFSDIDNAIASTQSLSRTVNETEKTDRYGKKYSWIAYFELAGSLVDHGKLDQFHDHGRCSDIDIDPSFPERVSDIQLIRDDYLGSSSVSMQDWITSSAPPNVDSHLLLEQIDGVYGPWVMLDGYFSQQDEGRGRKIFAFVRTFLVSCSEIESFEEHLKKQDLAGRWLPEKPTFYYTFAGEIPWCSTYPAVGNADFDFVESEVEVEDEREVHEFSLDGERVELGFSDLLRLEGKLRNAQQSGPNEGGLSDEELGRLKVHKTTKKFKKIEKKYKSFNALVPVCDFGWESHHSVTNNPGRATTLAKELAAGLHLRGRSQSFDLWTDTNVLATFQTDYRPADIFNSQSLMYLRRDLLSEYLDVNKKCLIGAIWGEREYSARQVQTFTENSSRPDPAYKVFSRIVRFNIDAGVWMRVSP